MSDELTETALDVMANAIEGVPIDGIARLGTASILQSLIGLNHGKAVTILKRCGVDLSAMEVAVSRAREMPEPPPGDSRSSISPRGRVLSIAFDEAMSDRASHIGTQHILLALLSQRASVARDVLSAFGVTLDRARQIKHEMGPNAVTEEGKEPIQTVPHRSAVPEERSGVISDSGFDRALSRAPTCMTRTAANVMAGASTESELIGSDGIGVEHVLLSLVHLNKGVASELLERAQIDRTAVRASLLDVIQNKGYLAHATTVSRLSSSVRALAAARELAAQDGAAFVETHHILIGLIADEYSLARKVLMQYGLSLERALTIREELRKDGSTEP